MISEYAKFYIAMIGSTATSVLGITTSDSLLGKICTVVVGVTTAALVWRVPNKPAKADVGEYYEITTTDSGYHSDLPPGKHESPQTYGSKHDATYHGPNVDGPVLE